MLELVLWSFGLALLPLVLGTASALVSEFNARSLKR